MTEWNRCWTFSTAHFTTVLECAPEDCPDLSWADPETLERLENGTYENVSFRVRVLFHGSEIAADYLGNSIYENLADFRKEHIGARGKYGSYFRDMVANTIKEARETLCDMPRLRCA